MSLKSFDDFCAKMINGELVQQKDIFDERQTLVRSRITIRALWIFIFTACLNILIMECGLQWCESYVLSTAIFGAAANLYWVIDNARCGTLFGINGTASATTQAAMFFGDALLIPLILNNEEADLSSFFFHNNMISEYFAVIIAGVLLIISSAITMSSAYRYRKQNGNDKKPRS